MGKSGELEEQQQQQQQQQEHQQQQQQQQQPTAPDPATCEIGRGQETLIEIDKRGKTLGISIVGGSDTTLNAIVIHEVHDTGAAWDDKRLWAGDQILSVDGHSLDNVTHEEAKNLLVKAGQKVTLKVWRDDKEIREEDLYDILSVELVRKAKTPLGFVIVGRSKDEGVLVSEIIGGGLAETDGRLKPGDRILEINGDDVRVKPHSDVTARLKSLNGRISFKIGRLKHIGIVKPKNRPVVTDYEVELQKSPAGSLGLTFRSAPSHMIGAGGESVATHVTEADRKKQGIFVAKIAPKSAAARSKIRIDDELVSVNGHSVTDEAVKGVDALVRESDSRVSLKFRRYDDIRRRVTVRLRRYDDRSVDFSIVGGVGCNQGDFPVYVRTVKDTSPASGRLFKGDRILFVNDVPMDGVGHEEAVEMLKRSTDAMRLVVSRLPM